MLPPKVWGESPEEVYLKLLAARTFRAGSLSLRQLRFACVDLELHTKYTPDGSESVFDVDQRVSRKTQVIPPFPEDRFLCGFNHILLGGYAAGYYSYKRVSRKTQVIPPLSEDRFLCGFNHIFAGYAAGYYSYKWAEVLSADAFSAFEDAGLDDIKAVKETGHKFRETIFALGGGKAPLEVFVRFRGREPSPEALLRHNGLLPLLDFSLSASFICLLMLPDVMNWIGLANWEPANATVWIAKRYTVSPLLRVHPECVGPALFMLALFMQETHHADCFNFLLNRCSSDCWRCQPWNDDFWEDFSGFGVGFANQVS
ncbi:hypothetical protein F3Y22_tig00111650pilonHSYRG00219 [Hibiscus syriacus]|uniref:Peptidase M3A/M3B catalytic domain-containing protein n=1 Tax=Hibiscus syriacus TaxID=106335 RepID=A0A6A2XJE2_HIBSY|nr:hypothetical protein F3Y22_tig00111650pilonHSYRG00219 [Hibiscus syriacus]